MNSGHPEAAPMSQRRSIEDLVSQTLADMGIPTEPLLHTVLLRDRHFVGHKYRFDGGWAIWLAEKGAVEVYDKEGKLLRSVVVEGEKEQAA